MQYIIHVIKYYSFISDVPMKVAFSSENGIYLDELATSTFFTNTDEFFEFSTYQELFNRIDLDPTTFGIIPINDSVNGINQYFLNKFFKRKYKIFGEIYLTPEIILCKNEVSIDAGFVYTESNIHLLCSKLYHQEYKYPITITADLTTTLEEKNNKASFLATRKFLSENKIKQSYKPKLITDKQSIRYFIIGRAFYDLPSDESDKIILIIKAKSEVTQHDIVDSLDKKDFSLFQIYKNESIKEDVCLEYYVEIGFYGLLDLQCIEKIAVNFNILGIIESGKMLKA